MTLTKLKLVSETRDFALLQDGTRKPIAEFAPGALLVACQRGEVRRITHFTRAAARRIPLARCSLFESKN